MTTYAIGDIQGCYDPLRRLLDAVKFDPSNDQVWFVGDLINRGPKSLETLNFIISLGDSARSILGNHECHFLAIAYGHMQPHKIDTCSDIINSPNAQELIDWVRSRPFFYADKTLGYSMVHAGLPPQWSIEDAKRYASEIEDVFRGDRLGSFLAKMYGDQPNQWDENLSGMDRLRFITNCFTRLRFCDLEGRLNFNEKGAIGSQDEGLVPWFEVPGRKTADEKILFGHWSTIGLNHSSKTICLDSGCLWGGLLSALTLDGSEKITSIECERSLSSC
ncbi:MAG: symmetrical bis(5'-nucleosyl)-tetraphosphatase [Gammaproteobacteria bacterium]|nr:symmetrical bis(5'-nucleosyl)-tetraphosphatase [Gammaproteobacteria bacterium]